MKKIFFLSVMNGSAWGGSEELWYQAALSVAKNGCDVGVCCFDWKEKASRLKELENAGCKLFLLPGKKITKSQPLLGKIKLANAFAKVPFEEYDNVIVSQGGWKDILHGPYKNLYRRLQQYVLIYHNYDVNAKLSFRKFSLLKKWADNATKNLGDTKKIFKAIEDSSSIKIPNQEKLFNPLTFDTPVTATLYPEIIAEKYILSVFAALDIKRKAQDVLIRTLAASNWRNRSWELRLYGEGKDKDFLQNLISELQLQSKIFLQGNAADYKEAIRQSHLILQLTHIDAMPITVMDSMAMARPLVVSNVGDMPFWVQENLNGWITASVSVETINQTLEQAWDKRNNWEDMGKQSFAIFKQHFPINPVNHFLKQIGITN